MVVIDVQEIYFDCPKRGLKKLRFSVHEYKKICASYLKFARKF